MPLLREETTPIGVPRRSGRAARRSFPTATGSPHQHLVPWVIRAPLATPASIGRRVTQCVDRCFLPTEMGRLGHQLVGFDDRHVGSPPKLDSKPRCAGWPPTWSRRGRGVLVIDVVAVDGDLVTTFQLRTAEPVRRTTPKRLIRPRGSRARGEPPTVLPWPDGRGIERGERLKDRGPHRIEIDGRSHHRQ